MHENIYQIIRKNLRYIRKKEHMTVNQLAEKSGISHTTINKIENGRSKNLEIETVDKLANALGVDPQSFFSPFDEQLYFVCWLDFFKDYVDLTFGGVEDFCGFRWTYAKNEEEAKTKFLEREFAEAYKEKDNIPEWFEDVKERAIKAYVDIAMVGDDLPEGINEIAKKYGEEISGRLWDISKPSGNGCRSWSDDEEKRIKDQIDNDKVKNLLSDSEIKDLYLLENYDVLAIPLDYLDEEEVETSNGYDFSGMWKLDI